MSGVSEGRLDAAKAELDARLAAALAGRWPVRAEPTAEQMRGTTYLELHDLEGILSSPQPATLTGL